MLRLDIQKHRLTLKRGGVQLDIPVHHAAFQEQSVVSYLLFHIRYDLLVKSWLTL